MKLLLDHCVPRPLGKHFSGHDVQTAFERGWATFKNGALLAVAEADGFEALVTTDQNLSYQQNFAGRTLALLVLVAKRNRLTDLLPLIPLSLAALESIQPGQVVEINLPDAE